MLLVPLTSTFKKLIATCYLFDPTNTTLEMQSPNFRICYNQQLFGTPGQTFFSAFLPFEMEEMLSLIKLNNNTVMVGVESEDKHLRLQLQPDEGLKCISELRTLNKVDVSLFV